MIEVEIKLSRDLIALPAMIEAAIDRALAEVAQDEAEREREKVPKATGRTEKSIKVERIRRSEYRVGPDVPYAYFVEHGRAPGTLPPISAIKRWVITKGIAGNDATSMAWAIAKSIAKKGTQRFRGRTDGFMPTAPEVELIRRSIERLINQNTREFAA